MLAYLVDEALASRLTLRRLSAQATERPSKLEKGLRYASDADYPPDPAPPRPAESYAEVLG